MHEGYKGKTCVVTGGAGFIGTHLCKTLTDLGATVVLYDYVFDSNDDVRDADKVESIIEDADVVFHLASLTEVIDSYSRPHDYYETNILGTLNVLEACRKHDIKSIVIASSDKAYGIQESPFVEDRRLCRASDPYSNSKRLMDELCSDYRQTYDMPIKVLRSVNTYGPGQKNKTTLITNTVERLLTGKQPIAYKGGIHDTREWLYIDDAVQAYLYAGLCSDTRYGSIWNVGSGEQVSVLKVIKKIGELLNIECAIDLVDCCLAGTSHQSVNSLLFRKLFPKWEPTRFDDGLKQTVNWYVQQWGKR